MKKLLLVLSCFLLLFPAFLSAQELSFKNITTEDGLPSSEVYCCLQDHNGYMWFSTDAGVCRYNGKEFRTFTIRDGLPDNTVFHLCEDQEGRIWCDGLKSGICYILNDQVFPIPANAGLSELMAKNQFINRAIYVDHEGTLWMCSSIGLIWIKKGDGYRNYHLLESLTDSTHYYAKKVDDKWLFATLNIEPQFVRMKTYVEVDNGRTKTLVRHEKPELRFVFQMSGITTKNGDLIFNICDKLFRANDTASAFITQLERDPIYIYYTNDGTVWVGTRTGGVYCYSDTDFSKPFAHYLAGLSVSYICADREGGMWFTTLEKGVMYCPSRSVADYRRFPGMDERICALNAVRDGLLIGTYRKSVLYYNDRTDEVYRVNTAASSLPLMSSTLYGPWIYTTGVEGISRCDTNFQHTTNYYFDLSGLATGPLYANGASGICVTETGRPLVIDPGYLRELHDTVVRLPGAKQKTAYNYERNLLKLPSRGLLLYQTRQKETLVACLLGLYEYKEGTLHSLAEKDSLFACRASQLSEDKNSILWLVSKDKGIVIRAPGGSVQLTMKDGLPANSCLAIDFDTDGNAWVGTTKGLVKVIVNYRDYKKSRIETYDVSSGIISNEIVCLRVLNKRVWLGTNKGICAVDIDALVPNTIRPPVFISTIQINEKLFSRYTKLPRLRYDDNNFRFTLEGLSYKGEVDFVYFLDGFDKSWSTTNLDEIIYQNLPPGTYRLLVYARNHNHTISKHPAVFSFTVPAPFWLTWWFIALGTLAVGGVLFLFVRFRLRRIRKQEEEKTHVNKLLAEFQLTALRAQMNPHFIFNAINSIQSFVLKNNSKEAYDYLAKFSKLIRMVLNNAQERIISLEKELSMLNLYVGLEELRFNNKFEYRLFTDPLIDDSQLLIPAMLIQPYVENAIWHGLMNLSGARKGILKVELRLKDGLLCITIEDNGVGREAARRLSQNFSHKSLGMELSQQRLELMNSIPDAEKTSIRIIDLHDRSGEACGTRVEITVSAGFSL